ncbi:uncharacterized protein FOMMEDRAFT_137316 [Fomitiporia mediterranea MF3/22]|uniref:uncharacterized protein n=1 Tax=Fomitiporia mediterranea (strain MF3/22) TaxID=694068 RepID=UPI0004408C4B|nr:uncharacterized protein FOMMEDRAFT_137316 [Fomitiporia mediterranea MF3/22]EJC97953.1 hypothetical protein FOMMEDRAFT_137316 [Fomitiporia mediterranea MF3/22]
MEAILYGFSFLMFMLTMWILLRNRQRRRVNYLMIISACTLQTLATMELIVNIIRICQAFLSIGPFLPRGPEQFFQDVTQTTWIAMSWLYNIQTLILDGVIYRTYVVWKNFYIIIVPALGWLALVVTCICLNVAFANAVEHKNNMFARPTGQWITVWYALTLATNLSATALLAFRIWRVNRKASGYRSQGRLASVLRIVIESGAIYSMTITAALITFATASPGVYVLLYMISPIISIVFNMIIVRVGFASDSRLPAISTTVQQGMRLEPSSQENHSGYELKSLEVEITQYIETDADASSMAETERNRVEV